jgi:hypothetical protein
MDILWEYRETTRSLSDPELLHLCDCDRCIALLAVGYMATSKENFEERTRQG